MGVDSFLRRVVDRFRRCLSDRRPTWTGAQWVVDAMTCRARMPVGVATLTV